MLKISKLADYAFRLLQSLACARSALVSATCLAEQNKLSIPTVRKVLKHLALSGIIESEQGHKGGYCLRHNLDSVSILDVIVAIDGQVNVTACAAQTGVCVHEKCCQMQAQWVWVNNQINRLLAGISLQTLFTTPGSQSLVGLNYSSMFNLMGKAYDQE